MNKKVSVVTTTYNQENFIGQAVESVLSQHADFDYEMVIGEDCSSDRTREIVSDFQSTYPDRIRILSNDRATAERDRARGLGGRTNLIKSLRSCTGEYVAFLDGDDYWIDAHKLEKQVALLEERADSGGCFGNAIVVDESNNIVSHDFLEYAGSQIKAEIRTEDIVPFGVSPANTILCRRATLVNAPKWFWENPFHCAIDLMISLSGPYLCLNEKLGAYRVHRRSVWSAKSLSYRLSTDLGYLKCLYRDDSLRGSYGRSIRANIERSLDSLLINTGSWRERAQTIGYFIKFMSESPLSGELIALGGERVLRRFINTARRRLRLLT